MGVRRWAAEVGSWLAGEGAWTSSQTSVAGSRREPAGPGAPPTPLVATGVVREGEGEGVAAYGGGTEEDHYWGRPASGTEEDLYWRRLSDNWSQKDVLPSTYLEIHNACYEAYNSNPLANYIVEITTNFVLGCNPWLCIAVTLCLHCSDALFLVQSRALSFASPGFALH